MLFLVLIPSGFSYQKVMEIYQDLWGFEQGPGIFESELNQSLVLSIINQPEADADNFFEQDISLRRSKKSDFF